MTELDIEPPGEPNIYRAKPDPLSEHELGVVDGDTYDLYIEAGFRHYTRQSVRAVHIDTAEYQDPLYKEQTEFVREWFRDAMETNPSWPLIIRSGKETGGFNRWLGEVFNQSGESLEQAILEEFGDDYRYVEY